MSEPGPVKILVSGAEKDAIRVTVSSESGGTEVVLEDGARLIVKGSVLDVWRLVNEYDPSGLPVYQVRAALITTTLSVPDALRKR